MTLFKPPTSPRQSCIRSSSQRECSFVVKMETTSLDDGNDSEFPWIEPGEPLEKDLALILGGLRSANAAAAEVACQIQDYYRNTYLLSDSLMKLEDDKGLGGFLYRLFELIFALARHIPYNHRLQDVLVQFIIRLRKLPPKEVETWNVRQPPPPRLALTYNKQGELSCG